MPDQAIRDLLVAVHDVQAELPEVEARIGERLEEHHRQHAAEIAALGRHARSQRRLLAVLAAIIVVLSVAAGAAVWSARQARGDAVAAQQAAADAQRAAADARREACQAGNQVRAGLLSFVAEILAPPPTPLAPDATPEQREVFDSRAKRREAFIDLAREDFALLDCG